MLAKSPTALSASLSTSVALYDNQRPPKTLHDILLQAQSHYISHRYVPALALYKLAAEGHNSIPACSSLYALYTSTLSVPGLIRSDTKATHILIHALRIWTARRWSYSRLVDRGSMRSSTRDEHDELEEYFAHPRRISKVQRRTNVSEISIPIRKHASKHSRSSKVVAQSVESEYRTPLHLTGQDNQDQGDSKNDAEEREDEDEGDDCEGCDGCDDYDDCDESDYEDEEQEKDEEGRRIGLATTEIEDIVQKLCFMVQKGVLGLDEPIVVAAVGILRKIERGLNKETGVREQKLARSNSFLDSALTEGAAHHADSTLSGGLLLTQGVDLSFLNFSLEEDCPIAEARIVGHSAGHHQKSRTSPSSKAQINAGIRCSPLNLAISLLPLNEQQRDQDMCRAIRIRIMFTLGWVHQQKGEYHYGAQAYGVCSEIASTGKRPLNVLQQQATVQKHKCQKLESDAQERAKTRPDRSHDRAGSGNKNIQGSSLSILSSKASARHTTMSCASSTYTSSEASTIQSHSDISSSSSVSSSDSGTITVHRPSGALSSFSAVWNSSLFRSSSSPSVSTAANVTPSKPDANIKSAHKLQRSQSLLLKAKIEPASDTSMTTGTNDSHHHDHHHPRAQQRSKTPQHPASSMLTMSGHQKKAVRCGYCGQTRILMPLCVCKKVRYCNSECRVSDLETHRLTGCHAAKAGIGASGLSTSGPSIAQ
ncbi:hypothetical protein BGZ54_006335 [Gamsiella multidivaricata]|nr:hypothetical protein BGZ54_006335 [Gamsiella multidivaricata]